MTKVRPTGKRVVIYRGPCARRMRNLEEVDKYLMATNSALTIDLFTFDPNLHTHTEFVPIKVSISRFHFAFPPFFLSL